MMLSASTVETPPRVGVVGAGLMGLGVAQAFAATGARVVLCGRDQDAALRGRARLQAVLLRQVARGRLAPDDGAAILLRVESSTVVDGLRECDLVIESVPEDRALKNAVLANIERAAPNAIVASNTSGLAIGGLARAFADPSRFLGLHFFSPAERMPLVEIAVGAHTADAVVRRALAFVRGAGKRPIVVRDGPGFFASRVFAAYLDEGVAMAAEGVAVESIESAAIDIGRALGPLAMLDETGISLNLSQARQARADSLEARFCRPLAESSLARLVAAGRSGRRSGGGFFDWPDEGCVGRGRGLPPCCRRRPISRGRTRCGCGFSARKRARRYAASRKASSGALMTATPLQFWGLAFPRRWAASCVGRRISDWVR
jgi:3-hydroxyacyl-CoA dehydrogenase